MKIHHICEKFTHLGRRCGPALLVAAVLLCTVMLPSGSASAVYILTGATDSAIILNGDESTGSVESFSSRMVYLHSDGDEYEASLQPGTAVAIRMGGKVTTATAQDETIPALLERLGIRPGPMDTILVDVSGDHLVLTIGSELVYYEQEVASIPYGTIRTATPDLPLGTERIVQAGTEGTYTAVYEIVYSGGEEISRQLVEEQEDAPVSEIIEYGTAAEMLDSDDRIANVQTNEDGSGLLTFSSGATLKFSEVKKMTATAYTSGHDGVGTITASGTTVHVGTVAVDRKVIPLGSRLYIVTNDGKYVYGLAVAEDTGVKGNKVDLYFDDYDECILFGRRGATVYILED